MNLYTHCTRTAYIQQIGTNRGFAKSFIWGVQMYTNPLENIGVYTCQAEDASLEATHPQALGLQVARNTTLSGKGFAVGF